MTGGCHNYTFLFDKLLEKENLSGGASPAEKTSYTVTSFNICGYRKVAHALPKVTRNLIIFPRDVGNLLNTIFSIAYKRVSHERLLVFAHF